MIQTPLIFALPEAHGIFGIRGSTGSQRRQDQKNRRKSQKKWPADAQVVAILIIIQGEYGQNKKPM